MKKSASLLIVILCSFADAFEPQHSAAFRNRDLPTESGCDVLGRIFSPPFRLGTAKPR